MNYLQGHVDRLVRWAKAEGRCSRYPATCGSILEMEAAFNTELGPSAQRKIASRRMPGASRRCIGSKRAATGARRLGPAPRRLSQALSGAARAWRSRHKKKVQQLTAELHALKSSKDVSGRVSEEWLLRVILAAPNVSGRALAEAFHLLVGSDRSMISRESVGRIRSAFLEMWRNMIFSSARDFISAQRDAATGVSVAATGASNQFVSVFMSHVQDEAELRLLSSDPSSRPGLPRRSRTSKVQMHVVQISCEGKTWDIPTELEALVDKTAATLATSFEKLVLSLLNELVPDGGASGDAVTGASVAATGASNHAQRLRRKTRPEVWFIHAIIGDGIATNEAAAKILLALASQGAFNAVRYVLLVGKCGTHQAALSATNGVMGRSAAYAAAVAGEGKEFEDVTATSVRLFKYLVPDYYEDMKLSSEIWIRDYVEAVPATGGICQPQAASLDRLQVLYTKHVIPDVPI